MHATSPAATQLPTGISPWVPKQTAGYLLREVLRVSGLSITWPVDSELAMELARTGGYDVDQNHMLYAARTGQFEPPKADALNNVPWEGDDVVRLMDYLESKRRWLPLHPVHVHKLSPAEHAKAEAEVEHHRTLVNSFASLDLKVLLGSLAAEDRRKFRQPMVEALYIRLGLKPSEPADEQAPAHEAN